MRRFEASLARMVAVVPDGEWNWKTTEGRRELEKLTASIEKLRSPSSAPSYEMLEVSSSTLR